MKNLKYILLIVFVLFVPVMMFAKKNNKLVSPTGKKMNVRPCDPAGCGYYGASRIGHTHQGMDVIIKPGDPVYAPVSGRVRRLQVYRNSPAMTGLEITGNDVSIKVFYVDVYPHSGEMVKAGDFIGYAQDVAGYYNNHGMTPHIHVEVRKDGRLINPEEYFKNLIA